MPDTDPYVNRSVHYLIAAYILAIIEVYLQFVWVLPQMRESSFGVTASNTQIITLIAVCVLGGACSVGAIREYRIIY